jgi:hypothetical protein
MIAGPWNGMNGNGRDVLLEFVDLEDGRVIP